MNWKVEITEGLFALALGGTIYVGLQWTPWGFALTVVLCALWCWVYSFFDLRRISRS